MTERHANGWYGFAAGALAMLLVVLLWFAWRGREDAGLVARMAVRAADAAPDLPRPRLPEAPHMPDAPIPVPK